MERAEREREWTSFPRGDMREDDSRKRLRVFPAPLSWETWQTTRSLMNSLRIHSVCHYGELQ